MVYIEPKNLKKDPVEETEEYKKVIDEVVEEAYENVQDDFIITTPPNFEAINKEIKRILKEKHDIDWKTPEEMNPDIYF
jgi:methionyl-tRNA synthetase